MNFGNGIGDHWADIDNAIAHDRAGSLNHERNLFFVNYNRGDGGDSTFFLGGRIIKVVGFRASVQQDKHKQNSPFVFQGKRFNCGEA